MDAAKIRLSPEEEELVATPGWILTKNRVIQKISQRLSLLQTIQEDWLKSFAIPQHLIPASSAKISRGENYKGLPWLLLDYPRHFSRQDVFAVRTLFWWGNFFSVTLHLSGSYKILNEERIIQSFDQLRVQGFYVCTNINEWEHHFEPVNFTPVGQLSTTQFAGSIRQSSFIKLAKKIPLEEWNEIDEKLLVMFQQLIGIVSVNSQAGEINP